MIKSSEGMFKFDQMRRKTLAQALKRLAHPSRLWVSFQFLSLDEVACLAALANRQKFRSASPVVVHKTNRVLQDFDICFPAPRIGTFDKLASFLESTFFQAGQTMQTQLFQAPFTLNDFSIQRYDPQSRGIGIHRDGFRYKNIVVIITLAGRSRLFATNDRNGNQRQVINDKPGRIVLLSAPGFAGRDGDVARPLHGVDNVDQGRLSLGFRVEDE